MSDIITFDEDEGLDLLGKQDRNYNPQVSIKKDGKIVFNKGMRDVLGNHNVIDLFKGYPDTKKVVLVFGNENDGTKKELKLKKIRERGERNKSGNLVVEKLGEFKESSGLENSNILPLGKEPSNPPIGSSKGTGKELTSRDFTKGDGLKWDTGSIEGKIIVEIDGTKGEGKVRKPPKKKKG